MSGLDWREGLSLAGRLGIAPRAFWQLSLIEWRALTRPAGPVPLRRDELTSLHANYPDKTDDRL